jgi:hypothetical protein
MTKKHSKIMIKKNAIKHKNNGPNLTQILSQLQVPPSKEYEND